MRGINLFFTTGGLLLAKSAIFAPLAAADSNDAAIMDDEDFNGEDDEADDHMVAGGEDDDTEEPPMPSSPFPDTSKEEALATQPFVTMPFTAPTTPVSALFWETFETTPASRWTKTGSPETYTGEFKFVERAQPTVTGDVGMLLATDKAHHGSAARLTKKMTTNANKSLFGSMEVQYETSVSCGGAYFKLFEAPEGDIAKFDSSTPYSIMFGPDRCGATNKVHFIIRFENPNEPGAWIEAHLKNPVKVESDIVSHEYGFAVHSSNDTYEVFVDGKSVKSGKMVEDFEPPFHNEKEIKNPDEKKPFDWIDDPEMPDPAAVRPADWDESVPEYIDDEDAKMPDGWLVDAPLMVPNTEAVKPEDWDDVEDGEWSVPMMKNPDCFVGCGQWKRPLKKNPDFKGKWTAPKIKNPLYRGKWEPSLIPNPDFYEVTHPASGIAPFDSIGFEIWTVEKGAMIDNLILTHDQGELKRFIGETYGVKAEMEARNAEIIKAKELTRADKKKKETATVTRNLLGTAVELLSDWKIAASASLATGIALAFLIRLLRPKSATTATAATATAATAATTRTTTGTTTTTTTEDKKDRANTATSESKAAEATSTDDAATTATKEETNTGRKRKVVAAAEKE